MITSSIFDMSLKVFLNKAAYKIIQWNQHNNYVDFID